MAMTIFIDATLRRACELQTVFPQPYRTICSRRQCPWGIKPRASFSGGKQILANQGCFERSSGFGSRIKINHHAHGLIKLCRASGSKLSILAGKKYGVTNRQRSGFFC
jgi:hypothetical protein